jgi:hypothetical protein
MSTSNSPVGQGDGSNTNTNTTTIIDNNSGGSANSSGDGLIGLPSGTEDPLAGLLGGSDTILPDTQHLDALGTLGPTLTQIEGDASGLLGSIGDLGVNPDTVTDVVPNDTGVGSDANGLVGQVVDDAQGALNGAGTGGLGDTVGTLLGDTGTGNLLGDTGTGAAGNAIGDLGNGAGTGAGGGIVGDVNSALNGAEGNDLGALGNGSLVDASALPGGAAGSSPLVDADVNPSQGSFIDALSADQGSNSDGSVINADSTPASSLGDVADGGALGAPVTSGDGGVNADAGNGQSLLSADALTGTLPDASDLTNGSLGGTVDGLVNGSSSSNLVDAGAGSQSDDGDLTDASVLTAPQDGSDAINGSVGNGTNLVTASALTGSDGLQLPSLSGSGADSLVGSLTSEPATQAITTPAETATQTPIADVSTPAATVDSSQILSSVASTAQQATSHALI